MPLFWTPQIYQVPQKAPAKICCFWCRVKIVNGSDNPFAHCWVYHSPYRTESVSSSQELSATTPTLSYIPFGSSSHLNMDDCPSKIQWDPQNVSPGRTSFTTYFLLQGTLLWRESPFRRSQKMLRCKIMATPENLWYPLWSLFLTTSQVMISTPHSYLCATQIQ